MKLVGRYDSPFVRRVAVLQHALGIPFEQIPLSPFAQAADLRRIAPIGRMPSIVLDDGEVLIDSAAILDYLDEISGPGRTPLPNTGLERRHSLRIVAAAIAACDKAIAIN
jgi:glutathione S-transferase